MHVSLSAISYLPAIELPAERCFLEWFSNRRDLMSLTAVAILNLTLAVLAIAALSVVVIWPLVSPHDEAVDASRSKLSEQQRLEQAA